MKNNNFIFENLIGDDFTFNLYAEEILYSVDLKNILLNGYVLDITEEEVSLEELNLNQIHITKKTDVNQYLLEEAVDENCVICFDSNQLLKHFIGELSDSLFLFVGEDICNTSKYKTYFSENLGRLKMEDFGNFFEKCSLIAEKDGYQIQDFIHQSSARCGIKTTFLKKYSEEILMTLFNYIHNQPSSALLNDGIISYLSNTNGIRALDTTDFITNLLMQENVQVVLNKELMYAHYNPAECILRFMSEDFVLNSAFAENPLHGAPIKLDLFETDIISKIEKFIDEQSDKDLFYYVNQPFTFLKALLDKEGVYYSFSSLTSIINDLSLVLRDYFGEEYRIVDNLFCDIYKSNIPAITDKHGEIVYLIKSKEVEYQLTLLINEEDITDVTFVAL